MRKNLPPPNVLAIVIVLILLSSCAKDFLSNGDSCSGSADIGEAKSIFESTATDLREIDFGLSLGQKSTKSVDTKSVITPQWSKPFVVTTGKFTIYEVPLGGDVKRYALTQSRKDGIAQRSEMKKVTTKLILKKNNETGTYIYFIATMVGRNEDKNVKEVNYTNNRSFTGHIFISDLNGLCVGIYNCNSGVRQRAEFAKSKTKSAQNHETIDGAIVQMFATPAAAYSFGETGGGDGGVVMNRCSSCGQPQTGSFCLNCNPVIVPKPNCRKCNGPYNNCYCCFICRNYPCTCYTPTDNCSYCGSYYCNGECQNTCYYCGSRYCSGGCQLPGGGGSGTIDPDPIPQPECGHVICPECKLPIGINSSTTRSIPSCSHSGSCTCWWRSGHNKLMEDALEQDLTKEQLDAVKKGSKDADKYQKIEDAYRHAMVEKGNTLEEAKHEMREHFITEIEKYKVSNNYESLGHALHMIQDVYSPAHSLKDWNGSVISYIPHIFEGRIFNRPEFNDALDATINIFNRISQCESNGESIGRVFDDFLRNFESQYVQ